MLNCTYDGNEVTVASRWKKCNRVGPVSTDNSSKIEYINLHPKRQYRVVHILPYPTVHGSSKRSRSLTHNFQTENSLISKTVKWNESLHYLNTDEQNPLLDASCSKQPENCTFLKNIFVHNYAFDVANSITADAIKLACIGLKINVSCKLCERQECNSLVDCVKSHRGKRLSVALKKNKIIKNLQNILATRKGSISFEDKPSPLGIDFLETESKFNARRALSKRLNSVIFFIHGLGGSADVWKSQLLFFSEKGYEVVAADLLGHGASSAPDSGSLYAFLQMLSDLLYIFDHYAKQRNIVVGHSYGCAFAACISQKRPLLVRQLVLISGGGPKAIEPRHGWSALLPIYGLAIIKFFTCHSVAAERKKSSHLTELTQISTLPRYVLKHILQGQDWSQGDRLFYRSLCCPTLLVYGLKDRFISLADEIEMEKTIPNSRLEVLPNSGHSVMLDSPRELNDIIFNFLSTQNVQKRLEDSTSVAIHRI